MNNDFSQEKKKQEVSKCSQAYRTRRLTWSQVLCVNVTWQKLCPQGVETGSSNRSRQMEQVNSCSENRSEAAASAIIILLLGADGITQ